MSQNITGLSDAQVRELGAVFAARVAWDPRRRFTPAGAVILALEFWRTNAAQAVLAKFYRVHQSTISRTITLVTRVLAAELERIDPPVTSVPDTALIVDGTLVPTGNRRNVEGTRSGHRRRHGMNVHVVSDLAGRILTASDPLPGGTSDLTAFRTWSLASQLDQDQTLADKAYQGSGMLTPYKKPARKDFHDPDMRVFNTQLAAVRSAVERCIAHLKNWKILATGYRGRITDLPRLLALLVRLERLRLTW
ncbi:Helix-turn-helix of DDE superfamily endonuclease [Actinokineospora globicatena]|uniref:transposase family protein n=1 Tax=Actinokineospora globicatena TaxID=103729 RepID=UPI0024A2C0EC|nr:transposase family protein [Actinokineospora globicatena]MCP2306620.1 Helix-turn-helix of DDE superfamily endonuclease [Actinokineospora globicatena]MCP2306908.1 Helix-turn-helix of DDE superfamily endonuclease [Actinokineospora globicatena]GLW82359.1 hypothetical protein Aglo01_68400 [Actinokineospora globicatena]GLW89184.1 hypothetical protein Aglo02_68230 [Actinokineospora globicatena]